MTLPHSIQGKHAFLVKMKEKSNSQKQIPERKFSLESLHQILGKRSTRSLLAGDTEIFWQDIEIKVDPNPFCTSFQISIINQKDISKTHLEAKTPFKWVFMEIIPATSSKSSTKDTIFANYLLIVDDYSKIPELYEMENITTEEVMNKLDMFQARSGKVD